MICDECKGMGCSLCQDLDYILDKRDKAMEEQWIADMNEIEELNKRRNECDECDGMGCTICEGKG